MLLALVGDEMGDLVTWKSKRTRRPRFFQGGDGRTDVDDVGQERPGSDKLFLVVVFLSKNEKGRFKIPSAALEIMFFWGQALTCGLVGSVS